MPVVGISLCTMHKPPSEAVPCLSSPVNGTIAEKEKHQAEDAQPQEAAAKALLEKQQNLHRENYVHRARGKLQQIGALSQSQTGVAHLKATNQEKDVTIGGVPGHGPASEWRREALKWPGSVTAHVFPALEGGSSMHGSEHTSLGDSVTAYKLATLEGSNDVRGSKNTALGGRGALPGSVTAHTFGAKSSESNVKEPSLSHGVERNVHGPEHAAISGEGTGPLSNWAMQDVFVPTLDPRSGRSSSSKHI